MSVAVINEARHRAETNEAKAIAAMQDAERERQAAVAAKEEESRQRLAAQESERRARAATEFLVNTFKSADEVFGLSGMGFRRPEDLERPLTARDILVRGRQRVDEDLSNEPLLRATLLDSLGLAHIGLGDFESAQPLLEEAFQIRTARLDADHPDVLASRVSLGSWKHIEGDFEAAEKLFREVLQFQERTPGTEPLAIARTKFHLAFVLAEQFRHAEADKLFQECLAVRREKLGDKHRDVALVRVVLAGNQFSQVPSEPKLADLLNLLQAAPAEVVPLLVTGMFQFNQIAAHRARREYAAAIAAYQPLLADVRQAVGTNHPIHLAMQFDLAGLHHQNGDYLTAEALSRDALTRAARIMGSNPRLAEVHFKLAQLLKDRGDDAEADFHFGEAMRLGRRVSNNPWANRATSEMAGWKFGLGKIQEAEKLFQEAGGPPVQVLLETGRTDEAVREAQSQFDAVWPLRATGLHDESVVYWTQMLSKCLRRQGDYSSVRRIENTTLAFVRELLPRFQFAPNSSLRNELRRFADFLKEQSDFANAEKLIRLSLEVDRAIAVPRHPELAGGLSEVAIFLRDHGDIEEAIKLFEEALEIRRSRLGAEHLATTATLLDFALARQKHGEVEEAIRLAREAHALRLRKFGAEDFRTIEAARVLANVLGQGQPSAESEKLLRESLEVYQRMLPATHSLAWQTVLELGDLLTAQQAHSAAAKVHETALRDIADAWPPKSWQRAEITSRLGHAYSQLKRFDDAEPLLRSSLETLHAAWGSSHVRFRQALEHTVRHFESMGNQVEAARLRASFPARPSPTRR